MTRHRDSADPEACPCTDAAQPPQQLEQCKHQCVCKFYCGKPWEACRGYKCLNDIRSRPYTPAPARKEECCKGCEADMCAEACQTWINEHDATIERKATLAAKQEMAAELSEILKSEWMCGLAEILYIIECVSKGEGNPFHKHQDTQKSIQQPAGEQG